MDATGCDLWYSVDGGLEDLPPGQVDRLWILDVEGNRYIVEAFHSPGASPDQITELTRMVESTTFTDRPS